MKNMYISNFFLDFKKENRGSLIKVHGFEDYVFIREISKGRRYIWRDKSRTIDIENEKIDMLLAICGKYAVFYVDGMIRIYCDNILHYSFFFTFYDQDTVDPSWFRTKKDFFCCNLNDNTIYVNRYAVYLLLPLKKGCKYVCNRDSVIIEKEKKYKMMNSMAGEEDESPKDFTLYIFLDSIVNRKFKNLEEMYEKQIL